MANTIKLKRSSTASDTPAASDLEVGELAINTADAETLHETHRQLHQGNLWKWRRRQHV